MSGRVNIVSFRRIVGSPGSGQTKECFCHAALREGAAAWRRRPRAAAGRGSISPARDLGLRARLAGHLPTSTPRARVYITRHPPPRPIHPRRLLPTKQTSLVRACNMRKEQTRIAPRPSAQIALISYAVYRLLHVEACLKASLFRAVAVHTGSAITLISQAKRNKRAGIVLKARLLYTRK